MQRVLRCAYWRGGLADRPFSCEPNVGAADCQRDGGQPPLTVASGGLVHNAADAE
jgi:hypothetical protein